MKNNRNYLSFLLLMAMLSLLSFNGKSQPLNKWLMFDGVDDYVDLGSSSVLKPTSALTVELWAFADWTTLGDARFISNTQSGGYNMEITGGYVKGYLMLNSTYYVPQVALSELANGWHHFALVTNGQYVKFYVDGQLKDTKDAGAVYPIQYNAANNTFLAAEAGGGSIPAGSYLNGALDEVRIWSIYRSQTEIQDNMNQHISASTTGLAGYWKLNETSGTVAADATSNGNPGTLYNMAGDEWMMAFTEVSNTITGLDNGSTDFGDYDNDGDLDIVVTGAQLDLTPYSKIYKNDGTGIFTATGISLPQVKYSDAAWGDYDNDGDLDLLIAGYSSTGKMTRIYTNNGTGGFSNSGISLPGVSYCSVDWRDYDNDGWLDFALTGYSDSGRITKIYRNTGAEEIGFQEQTSISLPGIGDGSATWGDCNNDGYPDLLLVGYTSNALTRLYLNDGNGGFFNSGNSFTAVYNAAADWGDYDNDGDLDIIIAGYSSGSGRSTILYINDGNGLFTNSGLSLTGVSDGSVAWGDYNNDGYADILLSGTDNTLIHRTKIYKNSGNGQMLSQGDISLFGVGLSSVSWGDFNNDSELDILYNGYDVDDYVTKLYRNNTLHANTLPSSPVNLHSSVSGNDVTLSWDAASDAETPTDGLSYNLYIGKSPGTGDVLSPMANISNGNRLLPAPGNMGEQTGKTIHNQENGVYYWSVQTIDNGYSGSPFAAEGYYFIQTEADTVPGLALSFDGVNDYVDIPDDGSLNSASFTVEFWLKPDILRIQHCIIKKNPGGGGRYWRIFMANANGTIEFDALPGEIANCTAPDAAQVGKWVHIAAVYDQSAQTVKIYANGELKSTVTGISDMGGSTDKGFLISNSSSPLAGTMEEVRFWNTALSQQQVRESMHRTLPGNTAGLVSYWQMNDIGTILCPDYVSTNHGLLHGNMVNEDWIESTVATGGGISITQTETTGVVAFEGTGLEMDYSAQNGASVTVTKINYRPGNTPEMAAFKKQYWVVNRFGTGSFNASLIFTMNEDISVFESNPSVLKLFNRESTSDGNWILVSSATSVNSTDQKVTFENISTSGQFIICNDKLVYNFPGNALDFNGSDDYVNVGNDNSLNTGNTLTIEAWIKPDDLTTRQGIFSTRKDNAAGCFQLEVGPGNGGTKRISITGTGTWVAQTGNNVLTLGKWNHIVYTRIGDGAGTHKIYVNGKLQSLVSDDPYSFIDNSSDKLIGASTVSSGFFNGQIDELRLWNIALDSIQIRENMHLALTGQEPGLVSYWQFNEGSGILTHDFISQNNGNLINMSEDNRVGSTIPFGGGVADSQTETTGAVDFTSTGLSVFYHSQNGAAITVSRIDTTANINPDELDVFDSQYWAVNRYGTGSFMADLTFTVNEVLTTEDENDPSRIRLFSRTSISDAAWSLVKGANSVNALTGQITFDSIVSFGQFIIGRKIPIINVNQDSLNFGQIWLGNQAEMPIIIKNDGELVLHVSGIQSGDAQFGSDINSADINPGDSIIVTITFTPTVTGSITDHLSIYSDDAESPVTQVQLSGFGAAIKGYAGTALEFNGTSDYVDIPDNNNLDITNQITIEAWINADSWKPNVWEGSIVCKDGSGSSGYMLRCGENGKVNFNIGTGAWKEITTDPADSLSLNTWYHIAATYNGINQRIYINGRLVKEKATSGNILANSQNLRFGSSQYYPTRRYNGKIEEVRLWNIALDSLQIRENMHLPLTGQEAGLVSYWQFNEGSGSATYDYVSSNYGNLVNMAGENWAASTIPFGKGEAYSHNEDNGTINFGNTGFSADYYWQNGAPVTVARIDTTANLLPDGIVVLDSQYWVVHRYGTGSFAADLTFTTSEDLTIEDENCPSRLKLYARGSTADTAWALLASGGWVIPETDQVTFFNISDFSQFIIARDTTIRNITVSLKAFIEGPFNGSGMNNTLSWNLPYSQPYNTEPWNYDGTEGYDLMPWEAVDWVLIELRDAPDAASVTQASVVARQACLVMTNGNFFGNNGNSQLNFNLSFSDSLFVVLYHRNSISVMSATPLIETGGVYTYDFTTTQSQAYGNGQADLGNGYYGLYSGDLNADGVINQDDLDLWRAEAGTPAYYWMEDANLDLQVDNRDKNDCIFINLNISTQVPE